MVRTCFKKSSWVVSQHTLYSQHWRAGGGQGRQISVSSRPELVLGQPRLHKETLSQPSNPQKRKRKSKQTNKVIKSFTELGMVARAFNHTIGEAKTGGSGVQVQLELHQTLFGFRDRVSWCHLAILELTL